MDRYLLSIWNPLKCARTQCLAVFRYWGTGGIAGAKNFRDLAAHLDTRKNSFDVIGDNP